MTRRILVAGNGSLARNPCAALATARAATDIDVVLVARSAAAAEEVAYLVQASVGSGAPRFSAIQADLEGTGAMVRVRDRVRPDILVNCM